MRIITKRIGYSNVILLKNGGNSILIDTGVRGHFNQLRILFRQADLQPEDVKLIVLTHTHFDHAGNLPALKKWTGAQVLVHHLEAENLKKGYTPVPPGMGRYSSIISKIGSLFFPKFASPKPFIPDIVNHNTFELNDWGIDGKIIHTPGHTQGSQSLLTGKILISGDTFINIKQDINLFVPEKKNKNKRSRWLLTGSNSDEGTEDRIIFPHFAEDPVALLQTWEKLFALDIEEIIPGHGPRFRIDKAMPEYEKWKKKLHFPA